MEQVDYLYNNYREPTPDWLMAIDRDSEIPWKQFFGSRTVFYPGAGVDPHTVNLFGGAHCAHCFINVDYLGMRTAIEFKTQERAYSERFLRTDGDFRQAHEYYNLKRPLFPDYTLIYSRSLSEGEFFAMFDNPYSYRRDPDLKRFNARSGFDKYGHFVKFYVFERNAECTAPRAVERFALLYLGADVFPVFNAVYTQGHANLFATIIEDYGFGCQYERFGNRELLHEMAKKANIFPEFILSERPYCVWKHYVPIEGMELSSCGTRGRWLHKIDKEAICLEAEFRDYQYKFFSHDFAKRFKVERRTGEKGVNFVDDEFARFAPKQNVRSGDSQGLNFAAGCFFNFLIPQIFGELGGQSAYYDYARATGWPELEYKNAANLSSAQILFRAGLIPGENDIAKFCRIIKALKKYFIEDLDDLFCGELNTLDNAAYARLCDNHELREYLIHDRFISHADEFVQSLKDMKKGDAT